MSFKAHSSGYVGNAICKGNGLKVYFELEGRRLYGGKLERKIFRFNVGNIDSIVDQVERMARPKHVMGKEMAVSYSQGLRNSFGNITFSQVDRGMIKQLVEEVKKWENGDIVSAGDVFENWSFGDNTLFDENSPLLGLGQSNLGIKISAAKIKRLEDLPSVDIVVVARGDEVDNNTGEIVDFNQTYIKRLRRCSFISSNFGLSAAGPLHNVNANMIILGDIENWKLAKEDEI